MGRTWKLALVVGAFSLIAAACGDSGGDSSPSTSAGGATTTGAPATTLTPQRGGSVSFGTFSEALSLDPIETSGAGSTSGNELTAIYDKLINYDPNTKQYTGKIAESFTINADGTEFTFKLRPNVKFADGTAYDAAAVKFNFDRHKAGNAVIRGPLQSMKEVTVVDPLTVKVALTDPWPGFITLVANGLGLVASPTAIQKQGANFKTNPENAGAGPFQYSSLRAKESLILKKNPTYWGGEPYLDEIKFINISGAGATFDAMKTGTLDFGFLREPLVVSRAKKDGFKGITTVMSGGEMLLINHGVEVTCAAGKPEPLCVGKPDGEKIKTPAPGADKRVRQAIQAAIDITVIDQRANEGTGRVATGLYDASFPWDPKVQQPKPDVEKAKRLVTEAKAAGFSGTIKFSCTDTPARQATALAVQTMLKAVGIELDMTRSNLPVAQVVVDVITNKNYELACWGVAAPPDEWAYTQFESFLRSSSASNRAGYKNPAMDAALDELKKAPSDSAKTTAFGKIAQLLYDDAVVVTTAHAEEYLAYGQRVQGVTQSSFTTIPFEKVWVNKK